MIARVVQFALALRGRPGQSDLAWARAELAPKERRLFDQLSGVEKAHAVRVAKKALALAAEAKIPEREMSALIKAALLHDVGKCGAVGPLDKVVIVLAAACAPALAEGLCQKGEEAAAAPAGRSGRFAPLSRLARAFYFDRTHPERGARMAAAAGSDPRVVALIRDHHASSGDLLHDLLAKADRGA